MNPEMTWFSFFHFFFSFLTHSIFLKKEEKEEIKSMALLSLSIDNDSTQAPDLTYAPNF